VVKMTKVVSRTPRHVTYRCPIIHADTQSVSHFRNDRPKYYA